ncbi:hypothetical protein [Rhodoplanes serenus]|uniref:hypothetical protein n=1 Tax=Rhodoplanes serenus TaxID=200615 RepID=UPI000DADBF0B|nr:hypothetical protein [Rhodoplanes serenus]RAI34913.1 hypothetical protein CH340_07605 [Rhodoplanes serenus]
MVTAPVSGLVARPRIGLAALLVALALPVPVATPVAAAGELVLGHGNVACRTWSYDRRNQTPAGEPRTAWVLGFLTAYSQYGEAPAIDVSRGKSTEEIVAAIDQYCATHPDNSLHKASSMLIETLRQQAKP